jgi:polyphosphate kinase
VFFFANGGSEEIYLGSADLMHRNMNRRVETVFPIEEAQLRRRIREEILENALADNTKIRWLQADGTHRRVESAGAPLHNFQEDLMLKYQSPSIV